MLYSELTPGSAWFSGSQSKALPCASETEHSALQQKQCSSAAAPRAPHRNVIVTWKQLKHCTSSYTHWITRSRSSGLVVKRTALHTACHCSTRGSLSHTLTRLITASHGCILSPLHRSAPWPPLSPKYSSQVRQGDELEGTQTLTYHKQLHKGIFP